ncbi:hypothetical protein TNCV_1790321 [Trichonephila clavipes]|nr:hypothetical protein TNCV_1790321 [Trichonephila clavipes]
MANWSQCEEFPKRKLRKGETIRNRNTSTESNKTSKRSPQISPSQLPSRALRNKNLLPELRPPLKKPLQSTKIVMIKTLASKTRYANSEDFFLDYPFLLEMGRQFSYAKDEERLDIFYQNLVKNQNRKA